MFTPSTISSVSGASIRPPPFATSSPSAFTHLQAPADPKSNPKISQNPNPHQSQPNPSHNKEENRDRAKESIDSRGRRARERGSSMNRTSLMTIRSKYMPQFNFQHYKKISIRGLSYMNKNICEGIMILQPREKGPSACSRE